MFAYVRRNMAFCLRRTKRNSAGNSAENSANLPMVMSILLHMPSITVAPRCAYAILLSGGYYDLLDSCQNAAKPCQCVSYIRATICELAFRIHVK